MNILLKGHRDRFAESCLRWCRSESHSITYLETADVALIGSLSKTGLYDWVIVDGHTYESNVVANPDDRLMTEREAADDFDVLRGDCCALQGDISSPCGITRLKNGMLQLHCGRHQLMNREDFMVQQGTGLGSEACVFEYQAPCKKR